MWKIFISTLSIVMYCWLTVQALPSRQRSRPKSSRGRNRNVTTSQDDTSWSQCGQHNLLIGTTVHFTSMNFPKPYPRNHRCQYEFNCDAVMIFQCSEFKIQRTRGCNKEFVSVYDASGRLAKTCGARRSPEATTDEGFLGVRFATNKDKIRRSGFNCSVSCELASPGRYDMQPDSDSLLSSTPPNERCHCGEGNFFTRIVGGRDTEQYEYPWQVGLVKSDQIPFCGGSLVSSHFVLTAAHCVYNIPKEEYSLVFGEHDWKNASDSIHRDVDQIFIHPDYDHNSQDYDITLIRVSVAIDIYTFVTSPVCLPTNTADYTGQIAVATGWGATAEFGPQVSTTLQEVEVQIIEDSQCSLAYSGRVTERMQCAGVPGGGKDSCQGDSGGPLVVKDNGLYVITGITSWGLGCAREGKPGVYTKVQSLLPWIIGSMGNEKGCSIVNGYQSSNSIQIPKVDDITTISETNTFEPHTSALIQETPPITTLPSLPCKCGPLIQPSMLMAHSLQHHPWTLSLYSLGKQKKLFCSGTIISTRNILTAASCVQNRSLSSFHIRANEETFGESLPRAINRKAVEVVINNDLALLTLATSISLTRYPTLKPACLPQESQEFLGSPNIHSGYDFGRVSATSGIWMENDNPNRLTFSTKTEAFCGEDLGGPIVTRQGDHNYLAGIAIDSNCGNNQESAKVSAYYDWIMSHHSGRLCSM
ncbi:unnamed protein product [Meganyctiphanes norvegica]|uniref:Uncharacterized protein n=1 Tax=Meganyctiphanes norvegica TaxID=48144 RepID=A0AAV2R0H3_MEGNR